LRELFQLTKSACAVRAEARPLRWLTSGGGGLGGDGTTQAEGIGLFAHGGDAEGNVLL
jgi:hypothetical protein